MKILRSCFFLVFIFLFTFLYSQTPSFQIIVGPRIGVNYLNYDVEDFSEKVSEFYSGDDVYYPVTSLFGFICEQRVVLGDTSSHFAFQEIVMLSGIEQSLLLPSASFLIGFRGSSGLEFGTGATFGLTGIGVIIAAGWTFSFSGVYIPVDLSFIIPSSKRPFSIALTTGFNFIVKSKI